MDTDLLMVNYCKLHQQIRLSIVGLWQPHPPPALGFMAHLVCPPRCGNEIAETGMGHWTPAIISLQFRGRNFLFSFLLHMTYSMMLDLLWDTACSQCIGTIGNI